MTKHDFILFYDLFVKLVKQEVGGEYCLNASAEFVNYCGGYNLVLRPECILWGTEISLLQSLCEKFSHTLEIDMVRGRIAIW